MIKKEFKIKRRKNFKDWNQFKFDLHDYLIDRKYIFYNSSCFEKEDFCYYKNIDDKYQIGILVYDFTKYSIMHKTSICFYCTILNIESRVDLSVSANIEVPDFEIMAEQFYETMIKFKKR